MALRNIIGFDHLPANAALDWRASGMINALDWWSNTRATYKAAKDANGYMQVAAWNTNVDTILQITEGANIPATAKKIYVGFNYKILVAAPANTLANGVLLMDTLMDPGVTPGRPVQSLLLANELPGYAVNKEYHIDICMGVESGIVERWIDNVKLADITLAATTVKTNLAARKFIIVPFLSDNVQTNSRYGVRDIFVSDDVDEGDGVVGRLGRQRVAPIVVDTVEGTGWTSSAATLKDGVLLAVDGVGVGATGPAIPTDLSMKMSAIALAEGETITGVQFSTSMVNSDAAQISASSKLQTEDGEVAGVTNTLISNTLLYGRRLGVFGRDAKGRPWTPARLAASKLVLRQA